VKVGGGRARAEHAVAEGEALSHWHCGHQAASFEVRTYDEYHNVVALDNFQQNLTGALEGPHAIRCVIQEISSKRIIFLKSFIYFKSILIYLYFN